MVWLDVSFLRKGGSTSLGRAARPPAAGPIVGTAVPKLPPGWRLGGHAVAATAQARVTALAAMAAETKAASPGA